jgi:hypothetical protein
VLVDGRCAFAVALRLGRYDTRCAEMRDRDLRGVAVLGGTVLVQHGDLVAHGVGIAEEVAGVGVARDEAQRDLLARAADEDRDALLQRPRVADRFLDGDRAALEARRALAPHERQQLERVLEAGVALGARLKVPAVQRMLALEPRRAQAAHRAPTRQHVERRDDLREVRDVAVGDAGDERPEPDVLGDAREIAEGRIALEHVLPLAPDLRDLQEVVHDPQAREAGRLGRLCDLGECRRGGPGMARKAEARDLQSEVEHHGILPLTGRRVERRHERRRHERHRPGLEDRREALPLKPDLRDLAQLRRHDGARHRRAPGAVALAHERCRRVEAHGDDRDRPGIGERAPAGAPLGIQASRIDDGRQPPREPLGDDELEYLEGVPAGALVALTRADDRAQPVRGDDLIGRERVGGPVRLAGRGGADEHDEARIGQAHGLAHAAGLPEPCRGREFRVRGTRLDRSTLEVPWMSSMPRRMTRRPRSRLAR